MSRKGSCYYCSWCCCRCCCCCCCWCCCLSKVEWWWSEESQIPPSLFIPLGVGKSKLGPRHTFQKIGRGQIKKKHNINYLLLIQLRVSPLCMSIWPNIHSFLSICMSLSLCLSVYLYVCPSFLYTSPNTCLLIMSVHSYVVVTLSVRIFCILLHPFVCQNVWPFICLCHYVCLSVSLSVLSI